MRVHTQDQYLKGKLINALKDKFLKLGIVEVVERLLLKIVKKIIEDILIK